MNKRINVTQPFLPPLKEFVPYLDKIWESKWLTNNGPFHKQLEQEIAEYLRVKHVSLFSNGTIALVAALQALRVTGEVITTPFSFVATAHSLLWNGLEPVFVDINPKTCNLDPDKIEAAITPKTTAIMPVHCYGSPCDVERIQQIADTYGLKIIHDAAHAFGVRYKGESLLNYGDLSVLSFHATKVFNTFEGGAIVSPNVKTKQRIDYLKNFGFADEITIMAPGINGKMNELQASFGLLQLKYIDGLIEKRRKIDEFYRTSLSSVYGITCLAKPDDTAMNYCYFPIMVDESFPLSRDDLYQKLKDKGIFARRYFYPLISNMPMYRGLPSASAANLQIAEKIAKQVICIPIYPDMEESDYKQVADLICMIGQE